MPAALQLTRFRFTPSVLRLLVPARLAGIQLRMHFLSHCSQQFPPLAGAKHAAEPFKFHIKKNVVSSPLGALAPADLS